MDMLLVVGGALAAGFALMSMSPPPIVNGVFQKNLHPYQQTKGAVDRQPVIGYTADYDAETGLPIVWKMRANGTREKNFCDAKGNAPPLTSNQ